MSHRGVSVYYLPSDGGQWAAYIEDKLTSKRYDLNTELNDVTASPSFHNKSAYLNVFIITPDFLDLQDWTFMRKFDRDEAMAVLTGTDHSDLSDVARACNSKEILEWKIFDLKNNSEEDVRELIITIICEYEARQSGYVSPASITRQVNDLKSVTYQDGCLLVTLATLADTNVSINIEQLDCPDVKQPVYSFPAAGRNKVTVFLNSREIGSDIVDITVPSDTETKQTDSSDTVTKRATCQKCQSIIRPVSSDECTDPGSQRSSDSRGTNTDAEVDINRFNRLSKLDIIRDLLEEETDPQYLICQCLGIDKDTDQLDEKMTAMVKSTETLRHLSFPPSSSGSSIVRRSFQSSDSAWPTLLHFGAQYNLGKFCDSLLNNPLMYSSCTIKNKDGLLPHQLAERNDHNELALQLEHFAAFVVAGKERHYDSSLTTSQLRHHDSGFSGYSTGTPRLSTILDDLNQGELPPPAPHLNSAKKHHPYEKIDSSREGSLKTDEKETISKPILTLTLDEDQDVHDEDEDIQGATPLVFVNDDDTIDEQSLKIDPRKPSGEYTSPDYVYPLPPSDVTTEASPHKKSHKTSFLPKIFRRKGRRNSEPAVTPVIDRPKRLDLKKAMSESPRSSASSNDSFGFVGRVTSHDHTPPPKPHSPLTSQKEGKRLRDKLSIRDIGKRTLQRDASPRGVPNITEAAIKEYTNDEPEGPGKFLGVNFSKFQIERRSLRVKYAKEDRNFQGPSIPSRKTTKKSSQQEQTTKKDYTIPL